MDIDRFIFQVPKPSNQPDIEYGKIVYVPRIFYHKSTN